MKKANNKQANNQQVTNNGCPPVHLGGVAYYDDKQYFLFSPDSVNQGVVEAFRRHGEMCIRDRSVFYHHALHSHRRFYCDGNRESIAL